jgi:hypothetical protein
MNGFAPIRGKCFYWREQLNEEDKYDGRINKSDWRVNCTCFVEGDLWAFTVTTVPADCPRRFHCRYYVRSG